MAFDIEIDTDRCMGSGNCTFVAPGAFELDDDSIATVIDPAGAPRDDVVAAVRQCPTSAISVREDGIAIT